MQHIYWEIPMPKCDFPKFLISHFGIGVLQDICCIFSEHVEQINRLLEESKKKRFIFGPILIFFKPMLGKEEFSRNTVQKMKFLTSWNLLAQSQQ